MVRSVVQRVAGWFGRKPEPPRSAPSYSKVTQVRASHGPPQSREEIQPIVAELQKMDRLLDVWWNPKQHMIEAGFYTPLGKLIPPKYDGRWNVIRHQTENNHPERGDWAVICVVSEPHRQDGILFMQNGGDYAPVGEWLLEFMRSADAANVRQFEALRKKLWAQDDAREAEDEKIDESEARAGLDRVHFKANFEGGVGNWKGRGADFAAMEGRKEPVIIQP